MMFSLGSRDRLTRAAVRARCHLSPRTGFTLLELMVVIGIIAVLLAAAVPAVNSLNKSSGRKAAISSLVGAMEQARAEAIKANENTYLLFPTFNAGKKELLDRYNHRSYAIFITDPGNPTQPKQLTTWKSLPTGVSLRLSSLAALPAATGLTPPLNINFTPDTSSGPDFRVVQFNSNGALEVPAADLTLIAFEGFVSGGNEVVTGSKDATGNPAATESLKVSHLTGRATYFKP